MKLTCALFNKCCCKGLTRQGQRLEVQGQGQGLEVQRQGQGLVSWSLRVTEDEYFSRKTTNCGRRPVKVKR